MHYSVQRIPIPRTLIGDIIAAEVSKLKRDYALSKGSYSHKRANGGTAQGSLSELIMTSSLY